MLRVLWDAPQGLTAREVQARVPNPQPAHTTVLTALDRLRAKGDVVRASQAADGIVFAAARTEEEHVGQAMLARLEDSSDRAAALLHFAGSLDADDLALLRRATDRP